MTVEPSRAGAHQAVERVRDGGASWEEEGDVRVGLQKPPSWEAPGVEDKGGSRLRSVVCSFSFAQLPRRAGRVLLSLRDQSLWEEAFCYM